MVAFLTPGPVLIVAAYVGYEVLGVTGAVTALLGSAT
jgi:chromate transport protein ChrA